MWSRIAIGFVGLMAVLGCTGAQRPIEVGADHPAHADASQAPFAMPKEPAADTQTPAAETSKVQGAQKVRLSQEGGRVLSELLKVCIKTSDHLASDAMPGAQQQVPALVELTTKLLKTEPTDSPRFWDENGELARTLMEQSAAMAQAKEIKTLRLAYANYSDAMEKMLDRTGLPAGFDQPIQVFICGMFKEAPRKGIWLQLGDEPRNPYYGQKMLRCNSRHFIFDASGKKEIQ